MSFKVKKIKAYSYMSYLSDNIKQNRPFKYYTIHQLGARLSGKTTCDNFEVLKAVITAAKKKKSLVIFIFRMRHKDWIDAWNDILHLATLYKLPAIINRGRGLIRIYTTKIYVKGCYTANSNDISRIGQKIQYASDYGIVIFEEAMQFDAETIERVLVAIRGIKSLTIIMRSNPYLLSNWFVQRCYREVPVNEKELLEGSGNQLEEKETAEDLNIYHYMRADVNPYIDKPNLSYLRRIKRDNPPLARTEFYGLPGSVQGMVFADCFQKIKQHFQKSKWETFTAGVDVGHVSSETAASLWALETRSIFKIAEWVHSNREQEYLESIEIAQQIISFFSQWKATLNFKDLNCFVDCSDPGFISLLNTEACRLGQTWFYAYPCKKIKVEHRISWYRYVINKGIVFIDHKCQKTLQELQMIAYDEKAEDDRVKLVKQNDHTWDADMYALTPFMKGYSYQN